MAEVAQPPAICGSLQVAGSAPHVQIVLRSGEAVYTLAGRLAEELSGYPGSVCVRGTDAGELQGFGRIVTVTSYHLVGDGKHAPIVGTIRAHGDAYVIETRDARRFAVVAADPSALAAARDRLVWITATWSKGALRLLKIGPLGVR